MKRIRSFVYIQVPQITKEVVHVAKVIFYQIIIALVVMGVLYISNYRVTITPNVQIVSPIVTEAK